MNDLQKEQRVKAYNRSYGVCAVCGKPLIEGQLQYAHKITNNQMNRKKYGSFFIDSTYNGEMVCSLACNSDLDVGCDQGAIFETLADILTKEIKDFYKSIDY